MSTGVADEPRADREVASWFGADIHLKDVLDQLGALRMRTARGAGPIAISSVLNLVAMCPDDDKLPELEHTIADLAEHQPSRAVVISEGSDGDSTGIDAGVSVSCAHEDGDRRVCTEQVTLTLRGAARDGAASAVEPLLRADLPTFVWWPGSLETATGLLATVCTIADRLITESSESNDPEGAVKALASQVERGGIAVTDLGWAAITPWRQMLVQLLGHEELERLAAAPAVLHISHRGRAPSVDAMLLAGWLRAGIGDRLAVEFMGRPDVQEGVVAVELESAAGRRLGVERIETRPAAAITVSSPGSRPRRRVLPMPVPVRHRLLAGELEYVDRDAAFERSLTHALELIR